MSGQEVTQLLAEWGKGNESALNELLPLVYAELRRIASRYMGGQNPGHILQPTALINEAFIRLAGDTPKQWANRAHFFAVAAKSMRHILVDHARANQAARRGGSSGHAVRLDEGIAVSTERLAEIVALDDALADLFKLSPRQGQVVELRYFGGLSVEETAVTLKVSPETVMRDWRAAKSWLYTQLNRAESESRPPHDA
jgi:RNA polymerase sigma factor (TIGR02999 family)